LSFSVQAIGSAFVAIAVYPPGDAAAPL
jgi:hypothetical protein